MPSRSADSPHFRWKSWFPLECCKKALQFSSGSQLHFPAKKMSGDLNLQNVFFGLNGLHVRNLTWQWKKQTVEDGISYQTWWCFIVMLVFGGVTVTKQKQQCFFRQPKSSPGGLLGEKTKPLGWGAGGIPCGWFLDQNQINKTCHVILMYDWNPGWGARSNIQCMPMNAFNFVVKQTVAANYWLLWVIFWFWWVFFLMTFHRFWSNEGFFVCRWWRNNMTKITAFMELRWFLLPGKHVPCALS